MKRLLPSLLVIVFVGLCLVSAPVAAQAPEQTMPRLVKFTGVVTGGPGPVEVTFALYADQTGGTPLWSETQPVAVDATGRYAVYLGASRPEGLPVELFASGEAKWLGVAVASEAELPRVQLVAVPYALKAADADTLGGKPVASFVLSENLAKAVKETMATATVSAQAAAVPIDGVVTLGHETDSNTWYGQYAGAAPPSGAYNAFFGQYAGYQTTTGCCNTFLGRMAGYANTSGESNVFVGNNAGDSNVSGSHNTFVGRLSGTANTAAENTFVGSYSGYLSTTGTENVFIGFESGKSNTTGGFSTYVGYQAGLASTGSYNTFLGALAGLGNTSGAYNAFVGRRAGDSNSTGSDNVALGWSAGDTNTTGQYNIFVGSGAGGNTSTESYNIFVGGDSAGAAGITNATAIGYRAIVTRSNSMVLGSISGENSATASTNVGIGTTSPLSRFHTRVGTDMNFRIRAATEFGVVTGIAIQSVNDADSLPKSFVFYGSTVAFMGGNLGVGVTTPTYPLQMASGAHATAGGVWTNASSRALKDQIVPLSGGDALRAVEALAPVTFVYKADPTAKHVGFIAEDVPALVATPDRKSLSAMDIVAVLTKAVQEQQATIADLQARLARLEALVAALASGGVK